MVGSARAGEEGQGHPRTSEEVEDGFTVVPSSREEEDARILSYQTADRCIMYTEIVTVTLKFLGIHAMHKTRAYNSVSEHAMPPCT